MKDIYKILGLVIIGLAIFFGGRLTVPKPPPPLDKKYIQMKLERDSIINLYFGTLDSLHDYMVLFNVEKFKGDSLENVFNIELNQKENEYEKLIDEYTNMSDDAAYSMATKRLNKRINNR